MLWNYEYEQYLRVSTEGSLLIFDVENWRAKWTGIVRHMGPYIYRFTCHCPPIRRDCFDDWSIVSD